MALARLEGHLQHLVSEPVAVQTGYGHGSLLVISHGNEAKALALVGVEVADHLDVGDGAEGPEHLPKDALVCVLAQVVDEDAPAGGGVPRNADTSYTTHVIDAHGGEPGNEIVCLWINHHNSLINNLSIDKCIFHRLICYFLDCLVCKMSNITKPSELFQMSDVAKTAHNAMIFCLLL